MGASCSAAPRGGVTEPITYKGGAAAAGGGLSDGDSVSPRITGAVSGGNNASKGALSGVGKGSVVTGPHSFTHTAVPTITKAGGLAGGAGALRTTAATTSFPTNRIGVHHHNAAATKESVLHRMSLFSVHHRCSEEEYVLLGKLLGATSSVVGINSNNGGGAVTPSPTSSAATAQPQPSSSSSASSSISAVQADAQLRHFYGLLCQLSPTTAAAGAGNSNAASSSTTAPTRLLQSIYEKQGLEAGLLDYFKKFNTSNSTGAGGGDDDDDSDDEDGDDDNDNESDDDADDDSQPQPTPRTTADARAAAAAGGGGALAILLANNTNYSSLPTSGSPWSPPPSPRGGGGKSSSAAAAGGAPRHRLLHAAFQCLSTFVCADELRAILQIAEGAAKPSAQLFAAAAPLLTAADVTMAMTTVGPNFPNQSDIASIGGGGRQQPMYHATTGGGADRPSTTDNNVSGGGSGGAGNTNNTSSSTILAPTTISPSGASLVVASDAALWKHVKTNADVAGSVANNSADTTADAALEKAQRIAQLLFPQPPALYLTMAEREVLFGGGGSGVVPPTNTNTTAVPSAKTQQQQSQAMPIRQKVQTIAAAVSVVLTELYHFMLCYGVLPSLLGGGGGGGAGKKQRRGGGGRGGGNTHGDDDGDTAYSLENCVIPSEFTKRLVKPLEAALQTTTANGNANTSANASVTLKAAHTAILKLLCDPSENPADGAARAAALFCSPLMLGELMSGAVGCGGGGGSSTTFSTSLYPCLTLITTTALKVTYAYSGGIDHIVAADSNVSLSAGGSGSGGVTAASPAADKSFNYDEFGDDTKKKSAPPSACPCDDVTLHQTLHIPALDTLWLLPKLLGIDAFAGMQTDAKVANCVSVVAAMAHVSGVLMLPNVPIVGGGGGGAEAITSQQPRKVGGGVINTGNTNNSVALLSTIATTRSSVYAQTFGGPSAALLAAYLDSLKNDASGQKKGGGGRDSQGRSDTQSTRQQYLHQLLGSGVLGGNIGTNTASTPDTNNGGGGRGGTFLPQSLVSCSYFRSLNEWLPHFPCYALGEGGKTTALFIEGVLRGQTKLSLQPVHRRDVLQSASMLLSQLGMNPFGESVAGGCVIGGGGYGNGGGSTAASSTATAPDGTNNSSKRASSRLGALLTNAFNDKQLTAAMQIAGIDNAEVIVQHLLVAVNNGHGHPSTHNTNNTSSSPMGARKHQHSNSVTGGNHQQLLHASQLLSTLAQQQQRGGNGGGGRISGGGGGSTFKVFPLFTKDGSGVERGEGHGPRKEYFDSIATMATSPTQTRIDLSNFLASFGGRAFVLNEATEEAKQFTQRLLCNVVVPSILMEEVRRKCNTSSIENTDLEELFAQAITTDTITARTKKLLHPLTSPGAIVCFFWNTRTSITTASSSVAAGERFGRAAGGVGGGGSNNGLVTSANSFTSSAANGGGGGIARRGVGGLYTAHSNSLIGASPPGTGASYRSQKNSSPTNVIAETPTGYQQQQQKVTIIGKDNSICFERGDLITYGYQEEEDEEEGAAGEKHTTTVAVHSTLFFSPELTVVQLSSRIPPAHQGPPSRYNAHLLQQQQHTTVPPLVLADASLPSISDCILEPATIPPLCHDNGKQFAWLNNGYITDVSEQKVVAMALMLTMLTAAAGAGGRSSGASASGAGGRVGGGGNFERLFARGGGGGKNNDEDEDANTTILPPKMIEDLRDIVEGRKELSDGRSVFWTIGWSLGNAIANGCCISTALPPILFEMLLPRSRQFLAVSKGACPTGVGSVKASMQMRQKLHTTTRTSGIVSAAATNTGPANTTSSASPSSSSILFINQLQLLDSTIYDLVLEACGWSSEELKMVLQSEGLIPDDEDEDYGMGGGDDDDDEDALAIAAAVKKKAMKASPMSPEKGTGKGSGGDAAPTPAQQAAFNHLRILRNYVAMHIIGDRVWGSASQAGGVSTVVGGVYHHHLGGSTSDLIANGATPSRRNTGGGSNQHNSSPKSPSKAQLNLRNNGSMPNNTNANTTSAPIDNDLAFVHFTSREVAGGYVPAGADDDVAASHRKDHHNSGAEPPQIDTLEATANTPIISGQRNGIVLLEALAEGFKSSTIATSPILAQCPARVAQHLFCGGGATDDGTSDAFKFDEQFTMIADRELKKLAVGRAFYTLLMDIFNNAFRGTEKRELLKFITGRTLLPPRPLAEHIKLEMPLAPMNAREFDRVLYRLPSSHSCGNVIEVPNYLEALLLGTTSPYYTFANRKVGCLIMDSHKEDAWRGLVGGGVGGLPVSSPETKLSKLFAEFLTKRQQEEDAGEAFVSSVVESSAGGGGGASRTASPTTMRTNSNNGLQMLIATARKITIDKLKMAVLQSDGYELDDAAVPAELLMDEEALYGGNNNKTMTTVVGDNFCTGSGLSGAGGGLTTTTALLTDALLYPAGTLQTLDGSPSMDTAGIGGGPAVATTTATNDPSGSISEMSNPLAANSMSIIPANGAGGPLRGGGGGGTAVSFTTTNTSNNYSTPLQHSHRVTVATGGVVGLMAPVAALRGAGGGDQHGSTSSFDTATNIGGGGVMGGRTSIAGHTTATSPQPGADRGGYAVYRSQSFSPASPFVMMGAHSPSFRQQPANGTTVGAYHHQQHYPPRQTPTSMIGGGHRSPQLSMIATTTAAAGGGAIMHPSLGQHRSSNHHTHHNNNRDNSPSPSDGNSSSIIMPLQQQPAAITGIGGRSTTSYSPTGVSMGVLGGGGGGGGGLTPNHTLNPNSTNTMVRYVVGGLNNLGRINTVARSPQRLTDSLYGGFGIINLSGGNGNGGNNNSVCNTNTTNSSTDGGGGTNNTSSLQSPMAQAPAANGPRGILSTPSTACSGGGGDVGGGAAGMVGASIDLSGISAGAHNNANGAANSTQNSFVVGGGAGGGGGGAADVPSPRGSITSTLHPTFLPSPRSEVVNSHLPSLQPLSALGGGHNGGVGGGSKYPKTSPPVGGTIRHSLLIPADVTPLPGGNDFADDGSGGGEASAQSQVDRYRAEEAAALQALHGGDFSVSLNGGSGFIAGGTNGNTIAPPLAAISNNNGGVGVNSNANNGIGGVTLASPSSITTVGAGFDASMSPVLQSAMAVRNAARQMDTNAPIVSVVSGGVGHRGNAVGGAGGGGSKINSTNNANVGGGGALDRANSIGNSLSRSDHNSSIQYVESERCDTADTVASESGHYGGGGGYRYQRIVAAGGGKGGAIPTNSNSTINGNVHNNCNPHQQQPFMSYQQQRGSPSTGTTDSSAFVSAHHVGAMGGVVGVVDGSLMLLNGRGSSVPSLGSHHITGAAGGGAAGSPSNHFASIPHNSQQQPSPGHVYASNHPLYQQAQQQRNHQQQHEGSTTFNNSLQPESSFASNSSGTIGTMNSMVYGHGNGPHNYQHMYNGVGGVGGGQQNGGAGGGLAPVKIATTPTNNNNHNNTRRTTVATENNTNLTVSTGLRDVPSLSNFAGALHSSPTTGGRTLHTNNNTNANTVTTTNGNIGGINQSPTGAAGGGGGFFSDSSNIGAVGTVHGLGSSPSVTNSIASSAAAFYHRQQHHHHHIQPRQSLATNLGSNTTGKGRAGGGGAAADLDDLENELFGGS